MSQITWIRGPVCGIDNCRSRLYRQSEGRKFCQFGHVMENGVEIGADDGEEFVQTRRLNIRLTETAFGSQAAERDVTVKQEKGAGRLYGKQLRLFHYKAMQTVLKTVTPMVVLELYGSSAELENYTVSLLSAVRLLWVRFAKVYMRQRMVTLLDVYALIYLGIRLLNELPVFIDEYLAMLSENRVPALNASKLLPKSYRTRMPTANFDQFNLSSIPYGGSFYRLLHELSSSLGLAHVRATPVDYFCPFAYKVFADLQVPQAGRLVCLFYELSLAVTKGYFLLGTHQTGWQMPELQAVALIHYVLVLYLSGSPTIPDPAVWPLAHAPLPFFRNKSHKMSTGQIAELTSEQVAKYCDWVYDNVLDDTFKNTEAEELDTMTRKLFRIFEHERSGPLAATEQPEISIVDNTLTRAQLIGMEGKLLQYFTDRFGCNETQILEVQGHFENILVQKNDRLKDLLDKSRRSMS